MFPIISLKGCVISSKEEIFFDFSRFDKRSILFDILFNYIFYQTIIERNITVSTNIPITKINNHILYLCSYIIKSFIINFFIKIINVRLLK